jgi:hypothetical protein
MINTGAAIQPIGPEGGSVTVIAPVAVPAVPTLLPMILL